MTGRALGGALLSGWVRVDALVRQQRPAAASVTRRDPARCAMVGLTTLRASQRA